MHAIHVTFSSLCVEEMFKKCKVVVRGRGDHLVELVGGDLHPGRKVCLRKETNVGRNKVPF